MFLNKIIIRPTYEEFKNVTLSILLRNKQTLYQYNINRKEYFKKSFILNLHK